MLVLPKQPARDEARRLLACAAFQGYGAAAAITRLFCVRKSCGGKRGEIAQALVWSAPRRSIFGTVGMGAATV